MLLLRIFCRFLDAQVVTLAEEGELGHQQVSELVVDEEVRLRNGRQRMAQVHSESLMQAFSQGKETSQKQSEAAHGLVADTMHAKSDELEQKLDDLRSNFVRTKLKNSVRLKKMQKHTDSLSNELAVADVAAASLRAELESCEWQAFGGDGIPRHQQGVFKPSPSASATKVEKMSVGVVDMRQLNYELGDAVDAMDKVSSELRDSIECAIADRVFDEVQKIHEEAKKNTKSKKFNATEATALIHMLRAENAGHKLRLDNERSKLEIELAKVLDLETQLEVTSADLSAKSSKADAECARANEATQALAEANASAAERVSALEQKLQEQQEQMGRAAQDELEQLRAERDAQQQGASELSAKVHDLEQRLGQAEAEKRALEEATSADTAGQQGQMNDLELQLQAAVANLAQARAEADAERVRADEAMQALAEANVSAAERVNALEQKLQEQQEQMGHSAQAELEQLRAERDAQQQGASELSAKVHDLEQRLGQAEAEKQALEKAHSVAAREAHDAAISTNLFKSEMIEAEATVAALDGRLEAERIAHSEVQQQLDLLQHRLSDVADKGIMTEEASSGLRTQTQRPSDDSGRSNADLHIKLDMLDQKCERRNATVLVQQLQLAALDGKLKESYVMLDKANATNGALEARVELLRADIESMGRDASSATWTCTNCSAPKGALQESGEGMGQSARVRAARTHNWQRSTARDISPQAASRPSPSPAHPDAYSMPTAPPADEDSGSRLSPKVEAMRARKAAAQSRAAAAELEVDAQDKVAKSEMRATSLIEAKTELPTISPCEISDSKSPRPPPERATGFGGTMSRDARNRQQALPTPARIEIHDMRSSKDFVPGSQEEAGSVAYRQKAPTDPARASPVEKRSAQQSTNASGSRNREHAPAVPMNLLAPTPWASVETDPVHSSRYPPPHTMVHDVAEKHAALPSFLLPVPSPRASAPPKPPVAEAPNMALLPQKALQTQTFHAPSTAMPMPVADDSSPALPSSEVVAEKSKHVAPLQDVALPKASSTDTYSNIAEKPTLSGASTLAPLSIPVSDSSPIARVMAGQASGTPPTFETVPATNVHLGAVPVEITEGQHALVVGQQFQEQMGRAAQDELEQLRAERDAQQQSTNELSAKAHDLEQRLGQAEAEKRALEEATSAADSAAKERSAEAVSQAHNTESASKEAWLNELEVELQRSIEVNASLLEDNATSRKEIASLKATLDILRLGPKRHLAKVATRELRLDDVQQLDSPYAERETAARNLEGQRGSPSTAFERLLQARYQVALFQQARYGSVDLSKLETPLADNSDVEFLPSRRMERPVDRVELAHQMRLQRRGEASADAASLHAQQATEADMSPLFARPPPTPEDGGHEEACKRFIARLRLIRTARAWLVRHRARKLEGTRVGTAPNPAWTLERPPGESAPTVDLRIGNQRPAIMPRAAGMPNIFRPPLPPRHSPRTLPNSASLPALPMVAPSSLTPSAPWGLSGIAVSNVVFQESPNPPLPSMLLPPPKPRWKPTPNSPPSTKESGARRGIRTSDWTTAPVMEHTADSFPGALAPASPQVHLSPAISPAAYASRPTGAGRLSSMRSP